MAIPLAAQSQSPTFSHDIAPIIYKNCASCHRPGESAPFSLLNYEDVRKHARQIAVVTKSRYMPPWLPQPGYGEFQDEHRLTDAQIKLIADWVAAGMPEGNPAETPPPPTFTEGWQLGPPDLILKAPQPLLSRRQRTRRLLEFRLHSGHSLDPLRSRHRNPPWR